MKHITYASSKWSGETEHLRSLARAFADCPKTGDVNVESGQVVYTSSCDLGTHHICEQRQTIRACTLAQSRQSFRWLQEKEGM